VSIAEINALDRNGFIARFGFLFEHSPWIVEKAAALRPFADLEAMHRALARIVAAASAEQQLELLRAHPQLADKVAMAQGLTRESAAEQASAGLDRLSPEEFARFHQLNDAYFRRFGFPFIICVRLTDKKGILAAMQSRAGNDNATERAAALDEVGKIVWLRLKDAVRQ
jgi:2-oxo-4-hydroxy-4-carboxy-5-ureidoimidazoline decarboxylase